jgi:hypothetical protein
VEEINAARDLLHKEFANLQEEGKKYDFHPIIPQEMLLMKHKFTKV